MTSKRGPFNHIPAKLAPIALILCLSLLAGCNAPAPQAGEPEQDQSTAPVELLDTPAPAAESPEYTDLITESSDTRLEVSIAVTKEDTQGRIMQVVVHNDSPSETLLYWTDPGSDKVQRALVDDWGVQDLVTEDLDEPRGIALDTRRGKMLWTDVGENRIQRADLDGTDVEDLVTDDLLAPFGLALGDGMEAIFWSDAEALTLTRAHIDGSNPGPAVGEASPATFGTAADDLHDQIFWIESGSIGRANLDGSQAELVLSNDNPAQSLALDTQAGKLYWTEAGRIQRSNLDGTGVELLIDDFSGPAYGLALDVSEAWMYWTEFDAGRIRRARFDGSQPEEVVVGLETPSGLALLKPGDAYVQLPCGLILTPGDGGGDLQRMMVIQSDSASVPAGGEVDLWPYVICVDAGLGPPLPEIEYSLGTIAEGELLKLAECICERDLVTEEQDPFGYVGEQFGLQIAVWQVSGSLTSDDLEEQLEAGGGAIDSFMDIAEMFDAVGEMLPDYVDWIEDCGVEIGE